MKTLKTCYIARSNNLSSKSKKFLIFQEMEKISCALGLLLLTELAERELFKHKREIIFLSLPAAVFAFRSSFKLRIYEQLPVFLLF